jgi:ribosomal protein L37AE/L43A
MALQHSQYNCPTCKRATLHIRNTYDVPHVAHLLIATAIGALASVLIGSLEGLFAGIAWVPVWFLHIVIHGLFPPRWRCQTCGAEHQWFPSFARRAGTTITTMRPAKPAGPSSRAKVTGNQCPQCGGAMVAGVELGEPVLSCQACGQTFERAGG